MFNLDNISVKQFFLLQDEALFQQYMRFADPKDPFYLQPNRSNFAREVATPLGELSFGDVANIKHNLSKPDFKSIYECFHLVYRVSLKTYLAQDVVSYIYSLNWIKENINKIIDREKKSLGGDPDPLMDEAGVARLVPFGELNTLKSLAQQFGKSPEEIEKWKYNLVFTLMLHDKVSGEVQQAYNKLKYGGKG